MFGKTILKAPSHSVKKNPWENTVSKLRREEEFMAITPRYVLMCDDIRREDNGKVIVIGLYTPDMLASQIPFVMPSLAFFLNLESDRPGNFSFQVKVTHQDSGATLQQTQAMGTFVVNMPQQPVIIPVKFVGVVFNAPGLYSFSMEITGQREPIVSTFSVQLPVPQGGLQLQGGMQR